ncbi:unnamed protein product [Rotaria sp. Silwood2]|nr:unnamed protein product [Rotaria sp. Silwood2]
MKTDLETIEIKKVVESFHDFMIGRDYNTNPTPITAAAEVLYAFDMVMQGTQSTAVIVIGSSSTVTMFALVSAAFLRNIPILNIYIENSIIDQRIAKVILTMSSITIWTFSNRTFGSSESQQLNDLLVHLYK